MIRIKETAELVGIIGLGIVAYLVYVPLAFVLLVVGLAIAVPACLLIVLLSISSLAFDGSNRTTATVRPQPDRTPRNTAPLRGNRRNRP